MRFILAGETFDLTKADVERSMRGVKPENVRTHAVEVNGVVYPVKQVLEKATGVDRADFISTTARRDLQKLGFRLFREA
jgi:hypothetical protein